VQALRGTARALRYEAARSGEFASLPWRLEIHMRQLFSWTLVALLACFLLVGCADTAPKKSTSPKKSGTNTITD